MSGQAESPEPRPGYWAVIPAPIRVQAKADASALGARRVIAVSRISNPTQIDRPAWCRGKE